jgi:nonsense-mediated mRNA decay protein 3
MPKHCPLCNRSSDEAEFYGDFCRYCSEDKIRNSTPSRLSVERCKRCGRVRIKGRFMKPNRERLEEMLNSQIKDREIKLISYMDSSLLTLVTERTPEHAISAEKEISLIYKNSICEKCRKKSGSYYEAIVQLRGSRDRMEKLMLSIASYLESRDEFVAKVESIDNGFDMYISSKKCISDYIAARKLKPTVSYTLYGMKRGKKVYRNTYAIRI